MRSFWLARETALFDATMFVIAVGALSACRTPAVPPEPPPTETKPAAGAEAPQPESLPQVQPR